MDIKVLTWTLVLVLFAAPVLLVAVLKAVNRKRGGGGGSGWGGVLFISLCWIVAVLAIFSRVVD